MRTWARQVGLLWAIGAGLMLLPMAFMLRGHAPIWYTALAGAVDCLPAVVLGAIVLLALRGRSSGVPAARIVTAAGTAFLAFALLYPQLR